MNRIIAKAGILFLLFATGCTPYYLSNNFESATAQHKSVAVLPVEMIYTGKQPKNLTYEDMQRIEIAESQAFQVSFFNEVLRSTRNGKKPIRVDLQDCNKTIRLLEENGIGIRGSWYEQPEKLTEVLGVDAVIRSRIEKNQIMPDLASYGIEIGVQILDIVTNNNTWWVPDDATISKEVNANYSLLDNETGNVLWSISFGTQADWRRKSNEIINEISRKAAVKFPYRVKK